MTNRSGDRGGLVSSNRWRWERAVRDDPLVLSRERLVAFALALRMNKGGYCRVGTGRLASDTALSPTTVIRARRELVRLGWLTVAEGGGAGRANEYWAAIPEEALDAIEAWETAESLDANLHTGPASLDLSPESLDGVERKTEDQGRKEDGLLFDGVKESELSRSDGLVWSDPPVPGEAGVLADCDALVQAGFGRWGG